MSNQSIKQFLEANKLPHTTHNEKYTSLVSAIGLKNLIPLIPATKEQIRNALDEGEGFLNEIPLKRWDARHLSVKARLHALGINVISLSETVCLLKQAARMWVEQ